MKQAQRGLMAGPKAEDQVAAMVAGSSATKEKTVSIAVGKGETRVTEILHLCY